MLFQKIVLLCIERKRNISGWIHARKIYGQRNIRYWNNPRDNKKVECKHKLIALKSQIAIRKSQIRIDGTVFNRSLQLLGFADDIALVGRTQAAIKYFFSTTMSSSNNWLKGQSEENKVYGSRRKGWRPQRGKWRNQRVTFEDVSEFI